MYSCGKSHCRSIWGINYHVFFQSWLDLRFISHVLWLYGALSRPYSISYFKMGQKWTIFLWVSLLFYIYYPWHLKLDILFHWSAVYSQEKITSVVNIEIDAWKELLILIQIFFVHKKSDYFSRCLKAVISTWHLPSHVNLNFHVNWEFIDGEEPCYSGALLKWQQEPTIKIWST